MDIKLSRLRAPEVVAAAGAVLMLVALFALRWYGRPAHTVVSHPMGWGQATVLRWFVLVAVGFGLWLVVAQVAFRAPAIPACLSAVSTVVSLITLLGLVIRVLIDPPASRELGSLLELAGALLLLVGSFWAIRKEGIREEDGPGEIPIVELASPRSAA